MSKKNQEQGFTLVELITIMVIMGVLSASLASRLMPQSTLQLQAGRDQLVSALFLAQQKAMSQTKAVRLICIGAEVDIRMDSDGDAIFSSSESIRVGGLQYPIALAGGITLSNASLDYNRLGHTTAGSITLSKNSVSVDVTVSGTGYAY